MEIFPVNHYNSQQNSGGSSRGVPQKGQNREGVRDSFEPSSNADLANALTPSEVAMVMEKIRTLPEIRANLLIYTKDQVLQGKYNEPEMVSPIAESLIS